MPSYKLTYFDARGRAEFARLVFAAGGVKYEDNRVAGEAWAKMKPTTPFGQIPVLEVDGKMIAQTIVIAKYAATVGGIAGKDDFEKAQAESIVFTLNEITEGFIQIKFNKDLSDAQKGEKMKDFGVNTVGRIIMGLEKILIINGGDWLVGKGMTWADVALYSIFENMLKMHPEALKGTPKLEALYEKVQKSDKIAKWVKDRPVTEN